MGEMKDLQAENIALRASAKQKEKLAKLKAENFALKHERLVGIAGRMKTGFSRMGGMIMQRLNEKPKGKKKSSGSFRFNPDAL